MTSKRADGRSAAPRRQLWSLAVVLVLAKTTLPQLEPRAYGAQMSRQGEADAKQALRLYRQGLYEEAAKLFAKLSVDYPDMPVFAYNLGACFYYLRRPEPTISNLRLYLGRKQDIASEEKAAIERWIEEMEELRAQEAASAAPVAPSAAEAEPTAHAPAEPPPVVASPPPASAPLPMAAPPPSTLDEREPAAGDLTSPAPTGDTVAGAPFYQRWWFWTAVGVVAAGSVTTYLLTTRGTENACSGETLPCDAIK